MRPRPKPEVWAGMCPTCGTVYRVDVWRMRWRNPGPEAYALHACDPTPSAVARVPLLPPRRPSWVRLLLRYFPERTPETPFVQDTFSGTGGVLLGDYASDTGASWTKHDPEPGLKGNGTDPT